jgi:ABC transporter substrate binding protein
VKAWPMRVAPGLGVVVIALAVGASVHAQPATQVPRVGVLSPGSPTESPAVQREPFERGLRELGWRPGSNVHIEYRFAEGRSGRLVTKQEDLGDTFAAMGRARLGAIMLTADVLVLEPNRAHVAELAAQHRVPAMYPWRFYVDVGGLMSHAESIPACHHRLASYVDRILTGAKPADLPVEQSSKFELVVSLKTAKALDLAIPHGFLLRADEVIE